MFLSDAEISYDYIPESSGSTSSNEERATEIKKRRLLRWKRSDPGI